MRFRRNQYCPIHRSTDPFSAAAGSQTRRHVELYGRVSSALKIRITQEDTENSGHPQRCGNCSTARLWNRTGNAPSAMNYSPSTTTSCQTTLIPKAWEDRGETTILTTSKQSIGGATRKRGRRELTTERPILGRFAQELICSPLCTIQKTWQ